MGILSKNPIVNVRLFLNENFVAGSISLMVAYLSGGIMVFHFGCKTVWVIRRLRVDKQLQHREFW